MLLVSTVLSLRRRFVQHQGTYPISQHRVFVAFLKPSEQNRSAQDAEKKREKHMACSK